MAVFACSNFCTKNIDLFVGSRHKKRGRIPDLFSPSSEIKIYFGCRKETSCDASGFGENACPDEKSGTGHAFRPVHISVPL